MSTVLLGLALGRVIWSGAKRVVTFFTKTYV